MTFATLQDVYIDQLQDVYSANRQSLEATGKLVNAARNPELKTALRDGLRGITDGMNGLAEIISGHDAKPTGEFCKGMEGLVKEVDAHVMNANFDNDDVRDAVIITQYQRMAHYAMAGYGCCRAFANRLGLDDEGARLGKMLKETTQGDERMTKIAMTRVNEKAAA